MPTDDLNPMHKIGYGRGDDVVVRRVVPVESSDAATDIKKIMFELVEKDFDAWMQLPGSVRKLMIDCPADFTLTATESGIPNIIHCGIEFSFNGDAWVLVDIK